MIIAGVILCGFVVGVLSGITGMGGVLIPPFFIFLLGMDPHVAMGTTMASFLVPCVFAIWTHYRLGNIDWSLTLPLSAAGILCVLVGTELKAVLSGYVLNLVLAGVILVVGCLALRPVERADSVQGARRKSAFGKLGGKPLQLALLGGGVGVLSGMTGTGGPVLSVPAMLALGYPPLASVAAGVVYTFPVSVAGTVGNVMHGAVDFQLAGICALGQIAGFKTGFIIARRFNARALKLFVAWVCMLTGLFVLVRTLWF